MKFRLLGPLRVLDDEQPVPLGGTNQRAALGYLLLYPNEVVATSQLLHALWGDEAPPTARKILQNAISNLRRALVRGRPGDASVLLITHAPGYALRVEPDAVDVCRFKELAKRGQLALAESQWDAADRDLRAALSLWNGPALADLAEHGYGWPELIALQNAKLATLEDLMEAALATGRYLEVINELEPMVGSAPLRDRLCRQLMLALYHSGRHADALGVYRRTRSVLVGRLGLDPSPELRELERAILDHDPGLARTGGTVIRPSVPSARRPEAAHDLATTVTAEGKASVRPPAEEVESRGAAKEGGRAATFSAGERRRLTAVFVRAHVPDTVAPETLERVLAGIHSAVAERVGRFGGSGHQTMGPVLLALFGAGRTREDDARRAIQAAMEIARFSDGGIRLRVAVASGEALVVREQAAPADGSDRRQVTGHLFDTGLDLLFDAKPGVVRACENTRQVCLHRFDFARSDTRAGGYEVAEPFRLELTSRTNLPFVQRDREMEQLAWWLDDVRRRRRPHRVTVLGPAGIGKSRLMHEFRRHVTDRMRIRCLVGCNQGFGPDTPYAPLAGVVRAYAGISGEDDAAQRNRKLDAAMTGLVGSGPMAAQLADNLRDLIARPADLRRLAVRVDYRAAFLAWRWFVEELAARQPVVIVLEDLNLVDDVLLKFIGDLVENAGDLPVLLVVTARPELASRPEYWVGGNRSATTMSLEPLSRQAIEALLDELLPEDVGPGELRTSLTNLAGGNPLYAIEYARAVTPDNPRLAARDTRAAGGKVPIPPVVHNIVAARLDALTEAAKCVLYDASLLGSPFSCDALAMLGDQDSRDIQESLESLVRHELLRRTKLGPELGEIEYAFVHELIGEVASSRLSHYVRADKHRRLAQWLRTQHHHSPEQVVHHYHLAVSHTAQAGRATDEVSTEACDWLIEAGERSQAHGATRAAQYYYRAALDLCPPDHRLRDELLRRRELKAVSPS